MKALTILQPWASLIALGEKKIETRSWYTKYRGPLAIHAGKGSKPYYQTLANIDKSFNNALTQSKEWNPDIFETLPLGCVVATCNLVACEKVFADYGKDAQLESGHIVYGNEYTFGDYSEGRYAWILDDIRPLGIPIPFRGQQGLWDLDGRGL